MARRPVFTPLGTRPYVHEVSTEFTFHPGSPSSRSSGPSTTFTAPS